MDSCSKGMYSIRKRVQNNLQHVMNHRWKDGTCDVIRRRWMSTHWRRPPVKTTRRKQAVTDADRWRPLWGREGLGRRQRSRLAPAQWRTCIPIGCTSYEERVVATQNAPANTSTHRQRNNKCVVQVIQDDKTMSVPSSRVGHCLRKRMKHDKNVKSRVLHFGKRRKRILEQWSSPNTERLYSQSEYSEYRKVDWGSTSAHAYDRMR